MSVVAQLFGLVLIVSGVVAIIRRKGKGSAEFEGEREYTGRRAVILGVIWIVLGAAFVLYPSLMR